MKLLKVRIENINSLAGIHEIDFRDKSYADSGIFVIAGPTGSGKTSILDAVTLALFGKTPRMVLRTTTSKRAGKNAQPAKTEAGEANALSGSDECMVLTKGKKRCSAEVTFESEGRYWRSKWCWRFKRTKFDDDVELALLAGPDDDKGRIVAEKKREWGKQVELALGMDFETFTRSALLAQGAFAELLRAEVDDRAKILERITGTEIYTDIGAVVFERKSAEEAGVKSIQAKLDVLQPLTEEARREAENAKAKAGAEAEKLRKKRAELQADLAWARNLADARRTHEAAKASHERAEAQAPQAQAKRLEGEAAQRAEGPLAELRARMSHEKSAVEHEAKCSALTRNLEAAQKSRAEAELKASAALKALDDAKRCRTEAEPELEAIEVMDRRLAEAQAASREAQTAEAGFRKKAAAASKQVLARREAADRAAAAVKLLEERLTKLQSDSALAEHVSDLVVRTELYADSMEKLSQAIEECGKAAKDAKVLEAAAEKASRAADQQALRERQTAAELEAAQAARQAAFAGSTLEQKILEAREAAGCCWAGEWLLEAGEMLAAAKRLPPCEAAGELTAMLSRRVASLQGKLAQVLVGREMTPDELEAMRKAAEALEAWSRSAAEAEKGVKEAEKAHQREEAKLRKAEEAKTLAKAKIEPAQERVTEAESARSAAEARRKTAGSELEALLKASEADAELVRMTLSEPAKGRAEIERRVQALTEARTAAEAEREKLEAAQGLVREAAAAETSAQEAHEHAKTQLADRAAECETVHKARKAQYGERVAKNERKSLEDALEGCRKAHDAAQREEALWSKKEESLSASRKAEVQFAEESRSRAAEAGEKLAQKMKEAGFENEDALRAAERPREAISRLLREADESDKCRTKARTALEAAQKRIDELMAASRRDDPAEKIETELREAEAALSTLERDLGGLEAALEADARTRKQAEELVKALEEARARLAHWSRLSDLIGSKDGKRFRLIAQRFTFALLLSEASRILQQMKSRYQLAPAGEQGLDLAVRDMELAGIERTSFNLSGGETFIVSLALALALARVSTKRLQVDTLFLDEGFGSLDAASLDRALTALESLQQRTGKLIGIISHVRAVRERIGVQLNVRPRGASGESEISGPGVTQRTA